MDDTGCNTSLANGSLQQLAARRLSIPRDAIASLL
jgi:hypothetical protein